MLTKTLDSEILLIMTTESDLHKAKYLGKELLKRRLAFCISFCEIGSIYRWDDEIKDDKEIQLLIKTKDINRENIFNFLQEFHSYKVPEFICFSASASADYLEWAEKHLFRI
tara:strand:- start:383 stop:718 length:336 start_codon:yes stop_codon:yes gene_type:complete